MPTVQPARPQTTSPFGSLTVIADAGAVGGAIGRRIDEVRHALASTGLPHELAATSARADVEAVARAAFERGVRFVVAVGDDATVQGVVNAAFRDGATIVDQPVVGVLPAGSGCELVRSFGLPDDLEKAAAHLGGDGTYALDVMKVTVTDDEGNRRTLYGHNMAEIGLRGAVASKTAGLPPGEGRVHRFLAFWGTYLRWRPFDLTLHVDTKTHDLRAWDVLVANGQFSEGAQRLSPRSYPGDGVLDALAFIGPKADAYRMLPRIFMNGGHLPDPGVKELRSKIRVAIESDRPIPVVVDGRPVGRTPVTIQVVPHQLLLKV